MMMNFNDPQLSSFLKYALVVPAMFFLLSVAADAAATAVTVQPQSVSQKADHASPYGPVYRVGHGVSAPIPLKMVEAEFPKGSHYPKDFDAIVLVRMIVDSQGMPRDPHITRSFSKDFDAQAIKAVKHYRFKPAMRSGKPVAVAITIEVNFRMYGKNGKPSGGGGGGGSAQHPPPPPSSQ